MKIASKNVSQKRKINVIPKTASTMPACLNGISLTLRADERCIISRNRFKMHINRSKARQFGLFIKHIVL